MPIGDILDGKDTQVFVGDTAPPATEVGGLTSWSAPRRRNVQFRKYYGTTPTTTIVGKSEDTWQLGCDLTSGDTGQQYVIAKFISGDSFYVSFVDADGNGRYQQVKASGDEPQGQNPDNPNQATYSFGGVADPVDVGTGPG